MCPRGAQNNCNKHQPGPRTRVNTGEGHARNVRLDVAQPLQRDRADEFELGGLVPEVWVVGLAVIIQRALRLDLAKV